MTKPARVTEAIETGVAIMAYVNLLDATRLAVSGFELPSDLHVTLAYLEQEVNDVPLPTRALLQTLLKNIYAMPVEANVFARAELNFTDPAESCSVVLVQSQELLDLRNAVQNVLKQVNGVDDADTYPVWIPHITLGYGLPITQIKSTSLGPVQFTRLVISYGGQLVDVTRIA